MLGQTDWHKKHQDTLKLEDRVADNITKFAGTMRFLYVHIIWWGTWFTLYAIFHTSFDPYPFNLLTMILSLEAIVLSTLIMISQNRQASRDKIQAEHQFVHQERELELNTKLTKEVHSLAQEIKLSVDKKHAQRSSRETKEQPK